MKNHQIFFIVIVIMLGSGSIFTQGIYSQSNPANQAAEKNDLPQSGRSVRGNKLTSTENPALQLKINKNFKYLGTQSFIFYNIAQAEQYFFVDADRNGRIRRLYMIQFEGYLPTAKHGLYQYPSKKTVQIGGLEFIVDSAPRKLKDVQGRPDSDSYRAQAFLSDKGYHMASDDLLFQRLVHIVGQEKRREMLIIYLEDLSDRKYKVEDLIANGSAFAQWESISEKLLKNAISNMSISQVKSDR